MLPDRCGIAPAALTLRTTCFSRGMSSQPSTGVTISEPRWSWTTAMEPSFWTRHCRPCGSVTAFDAGMSQLGRVQSIHRSQECLTPCTLFRGIEQGKD